MVGRNQYGSIILDFIEKRPKKPQTVPKKTRVHQSLPPYCYQRGPKTSEQKTECPTIVTKQIQF